MSFIKKLFTSKDKRDKKNIQLEKSINPDIKEKNRISPKQPKSDKTEVTKNEKPKEQPKPKQYIRDTSIAQLQEKTIGFDNESVVQLELPNGSTFWAKNYYFSKYSGGNNEGLAYINFEIDGFATIKTQYGNITFTGKNIIIIGEIVTQGYSHEPIKIATPSGTLLCINTYLEFYPASGNIRSGYLSENLIVKDIEYAKDRKIEFPEDGNLTSIKIDQEIIQL